MAAVRVSGWRSAVVIAWASAAAAGVLDAAPAGAQEPDDSISVVQLREDLRVMRGALEESHVGLNWFISRQDLSRRFDRISSELTRPLTRREFHRLLLPLVAAIRHGHTTLTLPFTGEGYRLRSLSTTNTYLPFELRILDGRLYVISDLSEHGDVHPGAEIVAIDGRPASALIDTMRTYVSADGANDSYKMFQLGPQFQFVYLLDLLFGPARSFQVETRRAPAAAVTRRAVQARLPREMAATYRARNGRGIDTVPSPLRFRLTGKRAAVLTVSSFYEGLLKPGDASFEAFFASAFRQIRSAGVEDLIIDVRSNEGGNDAYVPLLYSYLADRPFQMARPTTVASASMSFFSYAEDPSDEIKAFASNPADFISRASDSSWVLKEEFDAERYRLYSPRPDRFSGRLYVLTNGGDYSATNAFIDLVYRFHRMERRSVLFVGEENGGDNSFGRVSGGQILRVVLPYSKQRLSIPLLGISQYFANDEPKAVVPDCRVTPSIRDVVAGTDRELIVVQERIARLHRAAATKPATAVGDQCPPIRSSEPNGR